MVIGTKFWKAVLYYLHFIVIGFFGYLPEIWFNEYIFNGEIVGGGGEEKGEKGKKRIGWEKMRWGGSKGREAGLFTKVLSAYFH